MSEKQQLLDRLEEIEAEEREIEIEIQCNEACEAVKTCIDAMNPDTRKWFKAVYMHYRLEMWNPRGIWANVHNGGCIWLYSPCKHDRMEGQYPMPSDLGSRLYYTKPDPQGRCYNDWLRVVNECTKNGEGIDLGKDKGYDEVLIEDLTVPGKCDINAIALKLEMPVDAVLPALTDLFEVLADTLEDTLEELPYKVVLTPTCS